MTSLSFSFVILVVQLCCLFPSPVVAKEICDMTGSSMNDNWCANERFKYTEAKLNKLYKELLSKLDEITQEQPLRLAELKPKLILAQRQWIKFRKNECDAISIWYTDGTLQGGLYYSCMEQLTKERIKTLSAFTDYRI